MKEFLRLPSKEQLIFYEQAAAKLNLPVQAVEKDFWVCWTLEKLFSLPDWSEHLTFKGGTSLSKVWKLIQRFSEDIDLTISRDSLGFTGETDPEGADTRSQKQARVKRLKKAARARVQSNLVPSLQAIVSDELQNGETAQIVFDEDDVDNSTILFHYPRVTPDESLGVMLPYVKIEMGPRGDDWPAHDHHITPYLEDAMPGTLSVAAAVHVSVLDAERTFLEKAMLLHEDTFRPRDRPRKPRMARHYYDLYCMIQRGVGRRAISDAGLLARVREHRQFYYPVSWVDYATMAPGGIQLVPSDHAMSEWRSDYEAMRDVFFFGDVPEFDTIMKTVNTFQNEFNGGTA